MKQPSYSCCYLKALTVIRFLKRLKLEHWLLDFQKSETPESVIGSQLLDDAKLNLKMPYQLYVGVVFGYLR
jgi:hypothetical protein